MVSIAWLLCTIVYSIPITVNTILWITIATYNDNAEYPLFKMIGTYIPESHQLFDEDLNFSKSCRCR